MTAIALPMFDEQRARMVEQQLKARGITDARVLAAFRKIPRHLFVPEELWEQAYTDHPLSIGCGQTISQPYIVALMTSALRLQGHERVLEIGAGSGYQSAILAQLALEVYAVERLPELLSRVSRRLHELGYTNTHLAAADGTLGWPEHAPYDAIVVSAGAPRVPAPLLAQLGDQGRMVMPIGTPEAQMLTQIEKSGDRVTRRELGPCVFVPLVGEHGWPER